MIGGCHRARPKDVHAEIVQRFDPLFEDFLHRQIALHPDAADFTGAVVEVEIGGELFVARLQLHRGRVAEMLFHVSARAEQALLFRAPQANANRSARFGSYRFQDPHRFHHCGAACSVIRRACRCSH